MGRYVTVGGEARARGQGVATALVVALGVFLIYLPAEHQRRLAAAVRATALRPFLAVQRELAQARVRAAELERLRAQVDSLVVLLRAQAPLKEENERLRALLGLRERTGPEFRAAEVVRPGVPGSENVFLVDVGSADGIAPGAPVITVEGLVGVIREVGARVSVGMDWGHPDFRASAMTADGSVYGIVEPRRGRFREDDQLVLMGTAFHTDLEPGTLVVTSGRGGVYPRGIPIGTVFALADAEAGWRKSYWLQAAVRPGSVTHALVGVRPGGGGEPGASTPVAGRAAGGWDLTSAWLPSDAGRGESAGAPPPARGERR